MGICRQFDNPLVIVHKDMIKYIKMHFFVITTSVISNFNYLFTHLFTHSFILTINDAVFLHPRLTPHIQNIKISVEYS